MAGASVNKVFLLGNIGRDPELRRTNSGKAVATFTLATSERGGRGDDSRTEWHRIVVWDRLAEQCDQYLSKGRQVFIEGRLQTRNWEDRSGGKRQTTEIVAHTVQFLGSQRGGGGESGSFSPPPVDDGDYSAGPSQSSRGYQQDSAPAPAKPEPDIPYKDDDEDIPF
jgi:single-strand DNA-binding protein